MDLRQPGALRLIATLAIAGFFSGLLLVVVYLLTLPRIQRNQAEALRAAIYRVLPGTSAIEPWVVREAKLVRYGGAEGSIPRERAAYAGYGSDGQLLGYAIPAEGPGFMDTIRLIYGLDPQQRRVVGMQVLDSRETPGLGDKIITDPAFLANFESLSVEPEIVPVKRGKKTETNEVDCITGATISSEAVVSILNRSSQEWLPMLHSPAARPQATQDGTDDAR